MEVEIKTPRVSNFLQVRLDKNIVDYLWSLIDTANNKKKVLKIIWQEIFPRVSCWKI